MTWSSRSDTRAAFWRKARGRQAAHPELGQEVLVKVAEVVQDIGKIESAPQMEARTMIMILAPRK
jgi:translation initiation factor IF-3